MTTRFTVLLLLALLPLAAPRPAGAQPPPATAPAGSSARAAGMALHDGTLPPGTLTVRVVKGGFSGNLTGVRVSLDTDGQAAKEATTGADGRAQFAHLTVGTTVRVSATVDGENLASDSIVLPAESGVRVLLVAGDQFVDTTKPGEVAQLPPISDAPPLPPSAAPAASAPTPAPSASPAAATLPAQAAAETGDATATLRNVMIALTILAFAAVAYGQYRRS